MTAERILLELLLHKSEQPIKALPHVDRIPAQIHLRARGKTQHEGTSCREPVVVVEPEGTQGT
jgi:hypothetical protein